MTERTFGEIARQRKTPSGGIHCGPETGGDMVPNWTRKCWPEILALYEAAVRLDEETYTGMSNHDSRPFGALFNAIQALDRKAREVVGD